MRAYGYARISDDDGAALGVSRQEESIRAICEAHGLDLQETLIDNSISAFSGKIRPAYQRLLSLVELGRVDVVVSFAPDRLHRNPKEQASFVELLQKKRVRLITALTGEIAVDTAGGELSLGMLGVMGRYESKLRSERVKAKIVEQAAQGLRQGGPRPYGWHRAPKTGPAPCPSCNQTMEMEAIGGRMRAHVVPCPVETERLRYFAIKKMEGVPLWKSAQHANEQGWPTASGLLGKWRHQTISQILQSMSVRGARTHKGQVANTEAWASALAPEEHDAVLSALRTKYTKSQPTPSLLGGLRLLHCGRCNHLLHAASPDRQGGNPRYACPKSPGACGSCSAAQPALETAVVALLLEDIRLYLEDPRRRGQNTTAEHILRADKQEIQEALERLTQDYYGPGTRLTPDLFNSQFDRLQSQLRECLQSLDVLGTQKDTTEVLPLTGTDPLQWWDSLSLEEKRMTLKKLIHKITLAPIGSSSGRKFKPERVTIDPLFGVVARRASAVWNTEE